MRLKFDWLTYLTVLLCLMRLIVQGSVEEKWTIQRWCGRSYGAPSSVVHTADGRRRERALDVLKQNNKLFSELNQLPDSCVILPV